jgi:hypothetical protein
MRCLYSVSYVVLPESYVLRMGADRRLIRRRSCTVLKGELIFVGMIFVS